MMAATRLAAVPSFRVGGSDTNLKAAPGMLGAALGLAIGAGLISAVLAASVPAGHADLSNFIARDSAVCVWNRYLFDCGSTSWSNRVG